MVVDRQTKKDIENASGYFGRHAFPVSGCFNGTSLDREHSVHINPRAAVRRTENDPELFKFLQEQGYNVPNFQPVSKYNDGAVLQLGDFEKDFKAFESPVILRDGKREVIVDSFNDLFDVDLPDFSDKAIALQPGIENGKRVMFSAIPGASGKNLVSGGNTITDGILQNTMPTDMPDEAYAAAVIAFIALIKDLGLDYATVIALVNEVGHEILDVTTQLNPRHAQAIGNYATMKHNQMPKHGVKQNRR